MGRKMIVLGAVLLLFLVSLAPAVAAPTGWSDDVRLTFNGEASSPAIAVNGSNIHVVWENLSTPYDLFYRKSEDFGNSWSTERRLTNQSESGLPNNPAIVTNENTIHIVHEDDRNGVTLETYYLRSEDNGETWTEESVISEFNDSFSEWPDIAVEGNNVYAVFGDERDGMYEIYFTRSFDGG
ncbi:MAG: sialidase family protein, partial [Thermoplasmata archaeon]